MGSLAKYNSKYLVPVSTVSISHVMGQNNDGVCLRPTYNIQLNGYLIYNAGSPTSSGTFGDYTADQCETIDTNLRLNSLIAKHCALGSLFSQNYLELELGTTTGSPNLKAYPKVVGVEITDSSNPSYWTYTVNLEADNLYCNGTPISNTGCSSVKSFEETWEVTYDEAEYLSESGNNRLFRVTHNVSAVGAGIAMSGSLTTKPYESAKSFVCARKGLISAIPSVCINGFNPSGTQYNYYETHNIDTQNGSYSLSESWYSCSGAYIENYNVEIQESSDVACPSVSIQGTIRGFDVRVSGSVPSTGTRFYNSNTYFSNLIATSGIYSRAQTISGLTLDSYPVSSTVGKNTFTGEITYNYQYRKLPFKWIPSAKFETVSYNNNWNEDAYATLQPLSMGELLHPINYTSAGVRSGSKLRRSSLSIDCVFPCGTGISRKGPRYTAPYSGDIQAVVNYYNPSGDSDNYFTVVDSQNETWDAQQGKYTYSVSWVQQPTGVGCELI